MGFNLKSTVLTKASPSVNIPPTVSALWVVASGAGGGGSGAAAAGAATGLPAGGCGELCLGAMIPVTPGATFTATIGAGSAGQTSNHKKLAGGDTVFGPFQTKGAQADKVSGSDGQYGGGGGGANDGQGTPNRAAYAPDLESHTFVGGFASYHQAAAVAGVSILGPHAGGAIGSGGGAVGYGGSESIWPGGGQGGALNGNGASAGAAAYGAGGGGGGGPSASAGTTGGNGADGVCVVFWVEYD